MHALACVALDVPETQDDIVSTTRARLAQEQNPAMAAFLVIILALLGVDEAYQEVMTAYRARRIDVTIMSAADARKMLLEKAKPDDDIRPQSFWHRYELYGPHEENGATGARPV
jgi:hypothetical protein